MVRPARKKAVRRGPVVRGKDVYKDNATKKVNTSDYDDEDKATEKDAPPPKGG